MQSRSRGQSLRLERLFCLPPISGRRRSRTDGGLRRGACSRGTAVGVDPARKATVERTPMTPPQQKKTRSQVERLSAQAMQNPETLNSWRSRREHARLSRPSQVLDFLRNVLLHFGLDLLQCQPWQTLAWISGRRRSGQLTWHGAVLHHAFKLPEPVGWGVEMKWKRAGTTSGGPVFKVFEKTDAGLGSTGVGRWCLGQMAELLCLFRRRGHRSCPATRSSPRRR